MRNVIVGTAGHVDHGKTCLIKALTGMETDRLKEEKKRGITIELGFADLPNDAGLKIGIIDVPGHERFVRNMLAGIGGIDLVLLVVAADEGVMPQTVEHFEILKMLGIKKGLIVLTKIDLVDEEWLELVVEDLQDMVVGTFLEHAPVWKVSAHTGENIEGLKQQMIQMSEDVAPRKTDASLLRIPIDRVFTIGGFGTVVTGTLTEGQISVGDEIQIYPGDRIAKVRSLQVHGDMVETALAGQRTAVNLLNIKKDEVRRGDVLAARGSLTKTMMLDAKLRLFDDARRSLENESKVHLYYGSAETLCKVVLLSRDILKSGQEDYVQLRLEEEVVLRKADRFIVRFYSPVETIGGGEILDAVPKKHKRNRIDILEALQLKEEGDSVRVVEQTLLENRKELLPFRELVAKLGLTEDEQKAVLYTLDQEGRILRLGDDRILHGDTVDDLREDTRKIASAYHEEHPLALGMQKGEFRKKMGELLRIKDSKTLELLLRHFIESNALVDRNGRIARPDFHVVYGDEHNEIRRRLEEEYRRSGFQIPELEEVLVKEKDRESARELVAALTEEGVLKRIDFQYYMHQEYWNAAMELLKKHIEEKGKITLAEYRDLLGASRKYAVLILEYLDQQKVTQLEGDARVFL